MESSLEKQKKEALSVVNVAMVVMLIITVSCIFCLIRRTCDLTVAVIFWGLICSSLVCDYYSRCNHYPWSKKAPIMSLREQFQLFWEVFLRYG